MAQFTQDQSLHQLGKLNELDFNSEADMCEKLHEDAERFNGSLMATLT